MSYSYEPTTPARPSTTETSAEDATLIMSGWVALLFGIEVIDHLLGNRLDMLGISPRDPLELPQIFTAPFLHAGFPHLAGNSAPLFILGLIVLLSGLRQFVVAVLGSMIFSGLAVWLFSAPNTVTVGASGVIFGLLTFVIVRGFFTRSWKQIAIGLVVFGIYGSILWGVLPTQAGVSWIGHGGGAVGGILGAWWMTRTPKPASL